MKKTLKSITAELKKLGMYVETHGNEYELRYDEKKKDLEPINTLVFSIDTLVNCCGVKEIGDLSLYENTDSLNKIAQKGIILLIQYAFINVCNEHTSGVKRGKSPMIGQPIIFCSNSVNECVWVDKAMAAMASNFTLVSTTRNGNKGNIIKVYISIQ